MYMVGFNMLYIITNYGKVLLAPQFFFKRLNGAACLLCSLHTFIPFIISTSLCLPVCWEALQSINGNIMFPCVSGCPYMAPLHQAAKFSVYSLDSVTLSLRSACTATNPRHAKSYFITPSHSSHLCLLSCGQTFTIHSIVSSCEVILCRL